MSTGKPVESRLAGLAVALDRHARIGHDARMDWAISILSLLAAATLILWCLRVESLRRTAERTDSEARAASEEAEIRPRQQEAPDGLWLLPWMVSAIAVLLVFAHTADSSSAVWWINAVSAVTLLLAALLFAMVWEDSVPVDDTVSDADGRRE